VNDTPEEPEGAEPGPEEGGSGPDDADARLRGWIDPDDRLWRHPSEVGAGRPSAPVLLNAPPRHPARGVLMVLVGVVAAAAGVASVVFLLSPASQRPLARPTPATVTDAPLTTLAGTQNTVPAAAEAAGHALVELEATTAHGTATLVGVTVAEGGLVATTADLLVGTERLVAVLPGGARQRASVVAVDIESDVALVDVGEDLPVAPFADDADLDPGSPDLTLSFVATGGSALAVHCTPGSVSAVGKAIAEGPAGGMASITSTPDSSPTAQPPTTAGEPLLDAGGSVVGLLYGPGAAQGTFLPSSLVVGVADDLRSSDKVVPGWLGISGTDAPSGDGATVESVTPGGPADHARLQPGQVIEAVNAAPVRTMAELRARLYVMSPGASVALSVVQGGTTKVVDVTLGRSS